MNNYTATGRLAKDPELRELPDGTAVCEFPLAVEGLAYSNDKVGYIDVSQSLAALGRAKDVLAIGQLVFTAYYAGATSGITISVAGQNEPSLLPNRTFASVVTVKDCEALLEP